MKIWTLFSGSSGNALLVEQGGCRILIDAGVGVLILKRALAALGVSYDQIDALFLTHDHSDHVKGVPAIARRSNFPIYGKREVLRVVAGAGEIPHTRLCPLTGPVTLGEFEVAFFDTPHDATASCGYRLRAGGRSFSVMTDLGHVPEPVFEAVRGSDMILIESNYDRELLRNGSYPFFLKRRIEGDFGHLSNDDCAETVCRLFECGTRHFLLGHLSRENNRPERAIQCTCDALTRLGVSAGEATVDVAPRDCVSRGFEL